MASSEGGSVIACHSVDQWKQHFQKGADSKKLVVVDFTASWCGPCRNLAPLLTEWAKKYVNAVFLKVDVDELEKVALEWEVEAMPTLLFLKEGKLVDKVVGAKKDEIQKEIEKHINGVPTAACSTM